MSRPRYADVVATLALFVALGGTSFALNNLGKGSVGTREVKDNSLRGRDVRNGTLRSPDIRDGAVRNRDIANNAITSPKLLNASVLGEDLAPGSVTGATVLDGSLTAADFMPAALRSWFDGAPAGGALDGTYPDPEIRDGAIGPADLASSLKDGAAADPTLRSLGAGSLQAAAGDDARFPTLAEKSALAGTSGTPGNANRFVTSADPLLPTAGQKSALAGTSGTPGNANRFVTGADSRLTDARNPNSGSVGTGAFATLPGAKARQTSAQTVPTVGSFVTVRLDQAQYSTNVTFDNPGDALVINTPGVYLVTAEVSWVSNATGYRGLTIDVGGPEVSSMVVQAANGGDTGLSTSALVRATAGQSVVATVGQNSGGNLDTKVFDSRSASLAAQWLGP